MNNIYVSTVGRGKDLSESSKVYKLDLDGNILASTRIPEPTIDLENPRGGCRGARGLALQDHLWVAGWDGLFELDRDTLKIKRGFWSQECRDIHQIYPYMPDKLRVLSTWNNCTYMFDIPEGEFYKWQDLTDKFTGEQVDPASPDTLHFNAMAADYVLLNRPGIIGTTEGQVIHKLPKDGCGHDLQILRTGEIVTNTASGAATIAIEPVQGTVRTILEIPRDPSLDGPLAFHGWTRGMSYLEEEDTLLIGSAPAMVHIVRDVSTNPAEEKVLRISDEVVECVFDVISD